MTCAACSRPACAHPDPIYAGIIPANPSPLSASVSADTLGRVEPVAHRSARPFSEGR